MQQVTLVLRGDARDIMDVVQLALAADLIASMTQDTPVKTTPAYRRRQRVSRTWTVGQQVVVTMLDRRKYPDCPDVGTRGEVVAVHANGMKSGVTMRYTNGGGKVRNVRLAGRMLKAVD